MQKDPKDLGLYHFSEVASVKDCVCSDYLARKKALKAEGTAIVVDNGSYQCRVGWANKDRPQFVLRSASTKVRGKKDEPDQLCVGNDIHSLEAAKSSLKTPFDQNVVTNFACQEHLLDYCFYHLGLGEEGAVGHPIVLTEPLCNPAYSRSMMSELLFECYGIPSLAYGVDSLYSLLYNSSRRPDIDLDYGMVVSSGFQATHVLPLVDGRLCVGRCRRIGVGGAQMGGFLQKLVQLRLPSAQQLHISRVQELVHVHCYLSTEYSSELRGWTKSQRSSAVRRVQLPYYQSTAPVEAAVDPFKEAQAAERRKKAGERLRDLNRKKRAEKVKGLQQKVKDLRALLELQETDPEAFEDSLEGVGLSSYEAVVAALAEATAALTKQTTSSTSAPAQGAASKGGEGAGEEEISEDWLESLRGRRSLLMEKRQRRQLRKQELSQRRSAASSKRMKIISQLADDSVPKKGKKPVKDTFGMDDDDWSVYKEISKDGGGSESEREEAEVQEIDKVLLKHDPRYKSAAAVQFDPMTQSQLQLGVERFRVPEVLYQPIMIGVDQEGLAEALHNTLQLYPSHTQSKMARNIFVTGGCSLLPNFEERLRNEVLAVRPFGSEFRVWSADDKQLDAWKGAALWSKTHRDSFISKVDYQERGPEYFKEHFASNTFTIPDQTT